MTVHLRTRDGLYRLREERAEPVRSDVELAAATGDALVAVADGTLVRSSDDGASWAPIDGPDAERYTCLTGGPKDTPYLGTAPPPTVHVSRDGGATWTSLGAVPADGPVEVYDPEAGRHREHRAVGGLVKDVVAHPTRPRRVMAAVELDGVHVHTPAEGWTRRAAGLHADVHEVAPLAHPSAAVAATGDGLYRTVDAGRAWRRLDTSYTYRAHDHARAVTAHGGRVHAALAAGPPPTWADGAGAVLLEGPATGTTLSRAPAAGLPAEVPVAMGVADDRLLAGTVAQSLDRAGTSEARVLERTSEARWRTVTTVPAGVQAIVSGG